MLIAMNCNNNPNSVISCADLEMPFVTSETYPSHLKDYNQWILWKLEQKGEGKPKEVPYSSNGGPAKTNDPETWTSFDEAFESYKESTGVYSGLGFVFTKEDPFIGFDWDHVRVSTTGEFEPEIWAEIEIFNS